MNAIQRGAYDFIEKPVQLDVLRWFCSGRPTCLVSNTRIGPSKGKRQSTVRRTAGESPPMQGIFEMIRRVAASDVSVLITGETAPARNWWPGPFITIARGK